MVYNVRLTMEVMVEANDQDDAMGVAQRIIQAAVSKAYGWNHISTVEVIHERN